MKQKTGSESSAERRQLTPTYATEPGQICSGQYLDAIKSVNLKSPRAASMVAPWCEA